MSFALGERSQVRGLFSYSRHAHRLNERVRVPAFAGNAVEGEGHVLTASLRAQRSNPWDWRGLEVMIRWIASARCNSQRRGSGPFSVRVNGSGSPPSRGTRGCEEKQGPHLGPLPQAEGSGRKSPRPLGGEGWVRGLTVSSPSKPLRGSFGGLRGVPRVRRDISRSSYP